MGAIVKCPKCSHQTRYDSSEIVERDGYWVIECIKCGDTVPIRKDKSLEEQIHEAVQKRNGSN